MWPLLNGKSRGRHVHDFDPVQLAIGTKVELEHTKIRAVAQRIAMDHLTEDLDYYVKLASIHLDGPRPQGVGLLVVSLVGVALASVALALTFRR